ncbi:MAG: hypothetical protein BGO41_15800 [Clostridiales bacterium 38-18]|nr:MAG: hypothetical protein BGO41_15800 [Clostridiales bacterium 38-18]
MLAKIIFTLILLIGAINPMLSIRIFEFWKLGRKPITASALKATRVFSIIAIVIVWVFLPS